MSASQAEHPRRPWIEMIALLVACFSAVAGYFIWAQLSGGAYRPPPVSFDGSSDELSQTVIVPTLDTPVPGGKNAIWCASFQIAWNHLKNDLAKGPVKMRDAQDIADRLNREDQSENDLVAGDYYAAAGWVKDGILEKIVSDMKAKFPEAPAPRFETTTDTVAVVYSFLSSWLRFEHPYFENDKGLPFTDSSGKTALVSSFGLRPGDANAARHVADQVRVLYFQHVETEGEAAAADLILDPSYTSRPYQMILARVPWKGTLAETHEGVRKKIALGEKERQPLGYLGRGLFFPNMNWTISHHFREVENPDHGFLNPTMDGLWLDPAMQKIQFRLDRSGAQVRSEAKIAVKGARGYISYQFDRPFLVILQKRDAKQPLFMMWVDNAELLCKWQSETATR
jgi:hypothetical protein